MYEDLRSTSSVGDTVDNILLQPHIFGYDERQPFAFVNLVIEIRSDIKLIS